MSKTVVLDFGGSIAFILIAIALGIYARQSNLTEQSFLFAGLSIVYIACSSVIAKYVNPGIKLPGEMKLILGYVVFMLIVFGANLPAVMYVTGAAIMNTAYDAGHMLGAAIRKPSV